MFHAASAQKYVDASTLTIIGRTCPMEGHPYYRVDTTRYRFDNATIRHYCGYPAGVAVLFTTDSRRIEARWTTAPRNYGWNMTPVLQRGMDLYVHSSGIGWENVALDADKELKTVETNGVGFVRMVSAAYNWFAEQRADEAKQRAERDEQRADEAKQRAEGDEQRASSKERKARIACITSIARTRGLGAAPAYSATKRMQAHYLECLSQQTRMRHLNIGITDIRPGFVATDLIAGSHFPLQLKAEDVARTIVRAIERGSEVVTIDWRYRLLVAAWQLIPRWLWVRLTAIK